MGDATNGSATAASKHLPGFALDQRTLILLASAVLIAPGLLNGLYIEPLYEASRLAYWAADALQYLALPVVVAILLIKQGRLRPKDWGFNPWRNRRGPLDYAALCLFVCFMYWLAYFPVRAAAYGFLSTYAPAFGNWTAVPQAFWPHLLVVAYYSVSAALVEEVAYRGLPWLYLSRFTFKRGKTALYVLSTSILFAAAHSEQGPHGVIAALSLGIIAAALYSEFQDLWPFAIAHIATDLVSFW